MNIYIPYSLQRDIFKGEELKFAIRSIEKYLTGWEDIILIGTAPDWFNGKVIEAGDIEGRKEESIYRKMLLIPDDGLYLRWDDDHFLLQFLNISDIDNWHNGPLQPGGSARYRAAIQNTLAIYAGRKCYNYDIHAPMIFYGARFKEIFSSVIGDVCVKSFYQNHWNYDKDTHAEMFMSDLKIGTWLPKEEIKKLIEGRLFFSTGTLFDPMREVLNELYPTPSKFEK